MNFLEFIIACTLFSISPGSGAAVSINNVITNGFKGASFGIVGLQSALALHLFLIYLGIGLLVSQSPTLYNLIKYLGIIYLAYLGIEKIIASVKHNSLLLSNSVKQRSLVLMQQGFTVNLTNPKSIIFLTAFIPQFINESSNPINQYLLLGGVVVFIDTIVMFIYSLCASFFRSYLTDCKTNQSINFIFGIIFIGIAISIAI